MLSKSDWLGIALTGIATGAGFLLSGTIAGIICMVLGVAALFVWHRTQEALPIPHPDPRLIGRSTIPSKREWEKLATKFRKYKVKLEAEYQFDDDGVVTWNVPPLDRRAIQDFKVDAAKAGHLARRAGFVPAKFRPDATTSNEDYWLGVVASRIEHKSDWDAGFNAGFIDDLTEASRIICGEFANESPE